MHPRFFTSCTPRLPERFPEKCTPKVLHSWFDNGAKKFNEESARWKEVGREDDFNNQFISSYINNNISTYQNISNDLHNNINTIHDLLIENTSRIPLSESLDTLLVMGQLFESEHDRILANIPLFANLFKAALIQYITNNNTLLIEIYKNALAKIHDKDAISFIIQNIFTQAIDDPCFYEPCNLHFLLDIANNYVFSFKKEMLLSKPHLQNSFLEIINHFNNDEDKIRGIILFISYLDNLAIKIKVNLKDFLEKLRFSNKKIKIELYTYVFKALPEIKGSDIIPLYFTIESAYKENMPQQLTELLNLVTNIPDIEDKFQFITKLGHAYCLSGINPSDYSTFLLKLFQETKVNRLCDYYKLRVPGEPEYQLRIPLDGMTFQMLSELYRVSPENVFIFDELFREMIDFSTFEGRVSYYNTILYLINQDTESINKINLFSHLIKRLPLCNFKTQDFEPRLMLALPVLTIEHVNKTVLEYLNVLIDMYKRKPYLILTDHDKYFSFIKYAFNNGIFEISNALIDVIEKINTENPTSQRTKRNLSVLTQPFKTCRIL
ncbi:TPA: hypothetical protein J0C83_002878 [Escherichia coli]|nr:hypothetical protein [Escherichia coli]